jgi:excisionase family DNA binding protein
MAAGKKYLSLEEAAQLMGVATSEVMRLREKGDLRGFADRGNWKFKAEDVEEARRRRSPDSNPDVPLIADDDSALGDFGVGGSTSDSDVRLVMGDDLKAQLTGSSGDVPVFKPKKGSDSDVRLVGTPDLKKESDSDVKLIKSKGSDSGVKLSRSDSDVRLAGPTAKLADSDSDVRLAMPAGKSLTDSDSDVRLAPPPGSDSDVKLLDQRGQSGGSLFDDEPLALDAGDSVLLDDESGVALGGDSGIRLTGDSSLRLSGESGIQLRRPQDSGILLERPGDSGFRLADDEQTAFKLKDDSGIKMGGGKSSPKLKSGPKAPPDDDLGATIPMSLGAAKSDRDRTDPEVPMLAGDDDDDDLMPKMRGGLDETMAETNVILFDEDLDEKPAAGGKKKKSPGMSSKELDTAAFDMESDSGATDDIMDAVDDSFSDDSLEEVFDAEDDDSFSDEGMSETDFATSRAQAMVAPVSSEWSGGVVMLLAFSSLLMIGGAWVASDLLGTVQAASGPVHSGLMNMVGGLFKS